MPPHLTITLLGTPRVELNNAVVTEFRSNKTQALLYYLAVTKRPHTRLALAGLLWGDLSDTQARVNLSKSLSNLRQLVGEYLEITRQTIGFVGASNHQLDVDELMRATTSLDAPDLAELSRAVERYNGPFLHGFYVRDAPDFEQWVLAKNTEINERLLQALTTLADGYTASADFQAAINYTQRILHIEPWREEAHQRLMMLLARNGQRSAALAHFETCRQILAQELAVPPDAATLNLVERIRSGEISSGEISSGEISSSEIHNSEIAQANGLQNHHERTMLTPLGMITPEQQTTAYPPPAHSPPAYPPPAHSSLLRHNLPAHSTPFIGRQDEVAALSKRLLDPDCRLLTLVGPGGMGKTRLGTEVASMMINQEQATFDHGVLYVPLESVSTPSGLVAAIAQAASFSFYEDVPICQQLMNYLREKQILLVLDNFEQLLEEASLLSEILLAASAVKILATSREMINLQEAWSYPVTGLPYPEHIDNVAFDSARYAAIHLFMQCAQRIGGPLATAAIHESMQMAIVRICHLVNGIPLGIELAASWLRVMPVDEIAQELEQSLDILTARHQNMPVRHRSIRAVLEHSWQLLNEREQSVLRRLALFRGSFDRAAAKPVAEAPLSMLAALVEKSLLNVEADGRYRLHEMLRQFLQEKLDATASEKHLACREHCAYYLAFLCERTERLASRNQREALDDIDRELDNIHAGWRIALEQMQLEPLAQAARGLYRFHRIRSRYQEGKELFAVTADAVTTSTGSSSTGTTGAGPAGAGPAGAGTASAGTAGAGTKTHGAADSAMLEQMQGWASIYQGVFDFYLGEYGRADKYLRRGLVLARSAGLEQDEARALNFLGQIAGWRGDKDEARAQLNASLARYREIDDKNGMADALHKLAQIDGSFGDYVAQKEVAKECVAISRQLGRPDWIASALDVLGWSTLCLGEYAASEAYYHESLGLSEEIGSQLGVALALGGIGSVAWVVGGPRLAEARDYFLRSLALCQEIGHRHHISSRLWYLGQVANDMSEYEQAQRYAEEGLAVARAIGSQVFAAYNLSCLGEAALATGDLTTCRRQLLEVLQLALDAQHLPPLAMALIQFACLRMREIEQSELDHLQTHDQIKQVLTLLRLISEHPGCWLVFRKRAEARYEEIAARHPQEVFAMQDILRVDGALEEAVRVILDE